MLLELHRQGLKISAIARQLGMDRKTVRRYIERGLEPPSYGPRPRQQKSTGPFLPYLRERLAAYPGLPRPLEGRQHEITHCQMRPC
jgi:transposase